MIVIAVSMPSEGFAQRYRLNPLSQILIEGTSSVNSFTCFANNLSLKQEGVQAKQEADLSSKTLKVSIPVSSLDCQNGRMNKDLANALKSDKYPEIHFSIQEVVVQIAAKKSKDPFELHVLGSLELAGQKRDISFPVSGVLDKEGHSSVVGSVDLLMTTFDIEPPVALFGLIKARDAITIRFSLLADSVEEKAVPERITRKGF